ncbi:transposase [Streptosporangium sp. NPDC006013]|uniref:transposase n=1 Tax=Streptosporangium sp. NPDC006013 TaxID=3155596 RepID=UPI0033A2F53A
MASKRRRFDPEFRAGAVHIVKETGKPVAQVAQDLGINPYTLHNWMHMDRLATQHGNGDGTTEPAESEQEELAHPIKRTEYARDDLLRKAPGRRLLPCSGLLFFLGT